MILTEIFFLLILYNFKEGISFHYKILNIDRAELKIDLVDIYGERAHALTKGDTYANLYLADKQCYELNKILFNKGN